MHSGILLLGRHMRTVDNEEQNYVHIFFSAEFSYTCHWLVPPWQPNWPLRQWRPPIQRNDIGHLFLFKRECTWIQNRRVEVPYSRVQWVEKNVCPNRWNIRMHFWPWSPGHMSVFLYIIMSKQVVGRGGFSGQLLAFQCFACQGPTFFDPLCLPCSQHTEIVTMCSRFPSLKAWRWVGVNKRTKRLNRGWSHNPAWNNPKIIQRR